MSRRVTVKVLGRKDYIKWTLRQWLHEIRDVVEREYGVEIIVEEVETLDETPKLAIGENIFLEGLPGEEGYLIEVLKKAIEEYYRDTVNP